jgi:hypothetical protein
MATEWSRSPLKGYTVQVLLTRKFGSKEYAFCRNLAEICGGENFQILCTGLYLDHCVNSVHESLYMFIHLPIPGLLIRSWEQCVAMKFYNPLYLVRMMNRFLAVIIGKSNTTVADWLGFLGQLTRNITMILFTIRTDTLTHLFCC